MLYFINFIKNNRLYAPLTYMKGQADIIMDKNDVENKLSIETIKLILDNLKLHQESIEFQFTNSAIDSKKDIDILYEQNANFDYNYGRIAVLLFNKYRDNIPLESLERIDNQIRSLE